MGLTSKVRWLVFMTLMISVSCKTHPTSERRYADGDPNKTYKLRLRPEIGSKYYFEISNGSEFEMEVNGKKQESSNKTDLGVRYEVGKDSLDGFVFSIHFDKLHIVGKNGEQESDIDADNGINSVKPEEKMMAMLKEAKIQAVVSPAGQVREVLGYKEIAEELLAKFNTGDPVSNGKIKKQWEQLIGDGVIRKNMDQMFQLFPDSGIHVGDRWKLNKEQVEAVKVHSTGSYVLADIKDGLALIHSEASIVSESGNTQLLGFDVVANLKGKQEGDYEMETTTGMLRSGKVNTHIDGTIEVMGRQIPVKIETRYTIQGRKE